MDALAAIPESYDRDRRPPEYGHVDKSINNVSSRSTTPSG
jgi:hypothetical protein